MGGNCKTKPARTELTKLIRLSTLDLITSVGDLAANRLGDVLFEQGDMLGAIDAWQRVLDYRTDSSLSRPMLLVKTGVALANAGRWAELDEVERQLKALCGRNGDGGGSQSRGHRSHRRADQGTPGAGLQRGRRRPARLVLCRRRRAGLAVPLRSQRQQKKRDVDSAVGELWTGNRSISPICRWRPW